MQVLVSGMEVEVSAAEVESSRVLTQLQSDIAAEQHSLPLSLDAFVQWQQGADSAVHLEGSKLAAVLEVRID